jgi:YVTN family beta-propeller protein
VASGDGLFFAQNMMYRHNVVIYDRAGNQVATIPDEVDLAAFGVDGGVVAQGSPVEAAFTPDGRFVYVSNYKMFGNGYNPVADDSCDRGSWDDSFVYKIDVATFEIAAVIRTGAVPKFLAVSPDGSRLVVTNWCWFDASIIDTATDTELGRVDLGRHPRGVAIRSDSRYAYVTVMGEARIDVVDLQSLAVVNTVPDPGNTPRHLVLSDDDRYLYVSNHKMSSVRRSICRWGRSPASPTPGSRPARWCSATTVRACTSSTMRTAPSATCAPATGRSCRPSTRASIRLGSATTPTHARRGSPTTPAASASSKTSELGVVSDTTPN